MQPIRSITLAILLIAASLLPACNSTPTKPDINSAANRAPCPILQTYSKEDEQFLGPPLGYAIRSGKLADAECLLKSGISPNAYDHMGESPLRIAITANNPDMVALLLKYGATTNRPSKDFQTPDGCGNENPVDVAKEVGNPKIIALLQGAETAGECTNRPLEEMKLMESVDPMRHPEMYQ
ncbi:MAG: ankyrin repeat domain-containing protein [Thiothrix sp.]|uniref:ankyrin repeat domain-containing protein n=1 Tax=Thiothrix sp. TaxID=1032 RepID=UPI00261D5358|nr:ankyrin repeat domain-containing protein [Thiothrix sp.]MDD5391690.1 ankyrin repeat domain-containing protein [Thiothrix sp.]